MKINFKAGIKSMETINSIAMERNKHLRAHYYLHRNLIPWSSGERAEENVLPGNTWTKAREKMWEQNELECGA